MSLYRSRRGDQTSVHATQFRVAESWPPGVHVRSTGPLCSCPTCVGVTFEMSPEAQKRIDALTHVVDSADGHVIGIVDGDWLIRFPDKSTFTFVVSAKDFPHMYEEAKA